MTYRQSYVMSFILLLVLGYATHNEAYSQVMANIDNQDSSTEDEQQSLNLRSNVMVDEEVVRLGDLFMESLSVGHIPIAEAPAPGKTVAFDARFLKQLARTYNLDWQPDSKFEKVLVGRMSQRLDNLQVTQAIKEAIYKRVGNSARIELILDTSDIEFVLPTNIVASIGVQNLQYDIATQRFSANLIVPADGPTLLQRQVLGTIYETIEIPVLNHAVSAGANITESDLQWISVRTDRLIGNVISDSRQLVGMTAKRPLRTGQMLRASDVTMTLAIRKNTLVTLALQSGKMNLTVTGRTLEGAAIGQSVRVVNVNSKKELTGIVQDSSTIVIPFANQLTLN